VIACVGRKYKEKEKMNLLIGDQMPNRLLRPWYVYVVKGYLRRDVIWSGVGLGIIAAIMLAVSCGLITLTEEVFKVLCILFTILALYIIFVLDLALSHHHTHDFRPRKPVRKASPGEIWYDLFSGATEFWPRSLLELFQVEGERISGGGYHIRVSIEVDALAGWEAKTTGVDVELVRQKMYALLSTLTPLGREEGKLIWERTLAPDEEVRIGWRFKTMRSWNAFTHQQWCWGDGQPTCIYCNVALILSTLAKALGGVSPVENSHGH